MRTRIGRRHSAEAYKQSKLAMPVLICQVCRPATIVPIDNQLGGIRKIRIRSLLGQASVWHLSTCAECRAVETLRLSVESTFFNIETNFTDGGRYRDAV